MPYNNSHMDTGAEFVSISNFSDGSVLITYRK